MTEAKYSHTKRVYRISHNHKILRSVKNDESKL